MLMSANDRNLAPVESPCLRVCRIDPETRLCTGCLRSIDEIAGWGGMSVEGRRAVMAALPGRRSQVGLEG